MLHAALPAPRHAKESSGTARAMRAVRVQLHPNTLARMRERGASESEVLATVETGERVGARRGRVGFRKLFPATRRRRTGTKELIAHAVPALDGWLVVTIVVRRSRQAANP